MAINSFTKKQGMCLQIDSETFLSYRFDHRLIIMIIPDQTNKH